MTSSSPDDCITARVIEVNKNRYRVAANGAEMAAELSGRFVFGTDDPLALPTVGDRVQVQSLNDNTLAIIHEVLPRTTLLKRKEPGKRVAFQCIAANIDVGLIVQSADKPNPNLLDRYLVMLNEAGISPVVIFNKTDLLPDPALAELRAGVEERRFPVAFVSTLAPNGIDALTELLQPRKSYCLLGPSGVGKTSLLNRLFGAEAFEVGDVRGKDGRGRHTTVRRQLIELPSGSVFIDTPGMRELGNFDVEQGLGETFSEFVALSARCRYRDCTHTREEGCAVVRAVESGELEESRYHNYLKLRKEAQHYDMSYRQKRQKDKSFGKMVKQFKKSMRDSRR